MVEAIFAAREKLQAKPVFCQTQQHADHVAGRCLLFGGALLRAVEMAGTDEPLKVGERMRALPVEGFFFAKWEIARRWPDGA